MCKQLIFCVKAASRLPITKRFPELTAWFSIQRNQHPLPHTQYEAGGFNIRAITSKCSYGSKASVYFSNDSFLPLHRSVCFMVARASVAQEGSPKNCRSLIIHQFIIGSAKKCSGNCRFFFEIEKRRPTSPSQCTNSDFSTEIVYWSRVTLCNLYYFIPKFSGVAIIVLPMSVRPGICFHGIGRERPNRISWKLVALQHIFCFYYVPVQSPRSCFRAII